MVLFGRRVTLPSVLRGAAVFLVPQAGMGALLYYLCQTSVPWLGRIGLRAFLCALYIPTLLWVFLVFRRRWCRPSLVPLCFLVSPALAVAVFSIREGGLSLAAAGILVYLYAVPWALAAFVVAALMTVHDRKKRRGTVTRDAARDEKEG